MGPFEVFLPAQPLPRRFIHDRSITSIVGVTPKLQGIQQHLYCMKFHSECLPVAYVVRGTEFNICVDIWPCPNVAAEVLFFSLETFFVTAPKNLQISSAWKRRPWRLRTCDRGTRHKRSPNLQAVSSPCFSRPHECEQFPASNSNPQERFAHSSSSLDAVARLMDTQLLRQYLSPNMGMDELAQSYPCKKAGRRGFWRPR